MPPSSPSGLAALRRVLLLAAFSSFALHAQEPAAPATPPAAKPAKPEPSLKDTLKLSDETWAQVEAILKEREALTAAESSRHFAALRAISAQIDVKLVAALTEAQWTAYIAAKNGAEAGRLRKVADEVRRRRELRQQEEKAVTPPK